jgi:hypothetical protein
MREKKIESNERLRPFRHKLTLQVLGTAQRTHFVSGDVGPMLVDNQGETIEQDRLSDNGEEDEMIPKQA